MAGRTAPRTDSGLAVRISAIASVGAAAIHFAVAPTHWQEWLTSGIFFVLLAVFQLVWAVVVLVRPLALVLAAGVVANLGAVGLWALSRTAGVPFGPHAGEPELVRAAGICALLLQAYVVIGAVWVWFRGQRTQPVTGFGYKAVLAGASTVIATAVAVGVASGLQHDHHSPSGTADINHRGPGGSEESHRHGDHVPAAPTPASPISEPPGAPSPHAPAPRPADDHNHEHHGH